MQHVTTLSLSLLALSILSGIVAQDGPRPCYFPNGRRAVDYVACNDEATGHSACCRNSNQTTCFATGLCYLDRGFYERGACTDQSWASDSCPGPCRDFDDSGQNILACSDTDNSFCCGTGGSRSCCQNTDTYFTFSIGQIAFINGDSVPRTRTTGSPTSTGAPTNNTSDPTNTSEPEVVQETPTGVLAGMAVGIAIPSLIAIAFAFLYFRERKRAKQHGGMLYSDTDNGHGHQGGGGGVGVAHSQFAGAHGTSGERGNQAERESFMWGNNNGHDAHGLTPIPPKYIPPERRSEMMASNLGVQQPQPQQPVGELPATSRTEGLSELGATSPLR